jgi:hypothetical protein
MAGGCDKKQSQGACRRDFDSPHRRSPLSAFTFSTPSLRKLKALLQSNDLKAIDFYDRVCKSLRRFLG